MGVGGLLVANPRAHKWWSHQREALAADVHAAGAAKGLTDSRAADMQLSSLLPDLF